MKDVKVEIIYDESEYSLRYYKIFTFKKLDEFPEDVITEENLSVTIFNKKYKDEYENNFNLEITYNDFRFIIEGSLDAKYILVSEFLFSYMRKHRENLYLYDPCGEMGEKWNALTYIIE